jgi:septum formation protein
MKPEILRIPILLASASPRRKFLLEEAGFQIRVIHPEVDEHYPEGLLPKDIPLFLARKKALALQDKRLKHEVIVAADSVVILHNKVLGKPEDRSHAIEMLEALSGTTHEVITGVGLLSDTREFGFSCKSEVTFARLTPQEINYYLDTYKPYDKAGSYGVQEWIGWCRIKGITGSYSNIMGLPVEMVYEALGSFIR